MRKIILTILAVLVLGTVQLAKATPVDSNSIFKDDIEYYIQTDKAIYDLGETVEMLYRVTNLGIEDVTFEFAYQQQCSFEVWDAETRIWGWPKQVNPAGSIFTLQPGEFKEYLKDWDMMNDNAGTLVTPGNYDVTGRLAYFPIHDRYVPVSVQIEIIPEPSTLLLLGVSLVGLLACNRKKKK